MSSTLRTVILEPAAELAHRELASQVPGFEEAYGELIAAISAKPRRGRPMVGGRWGYALAKQDKPRVSAVYTFTEFEIRVIDVRATPAALLPSAEE